MKKEINSIAEMNQFAAGFLSKLKLGSTATVVGLSGDLGSGKTTFMQGIAAALGIHNQITSPTFVIIKSYTLKSSSYKLLIHIDAYRLENGQELQTLRFQEIISQPTNLVFIEWPERVSDILPKHTQYVYFKFIDDTTREIR